MNQTTVDRLATEVLELLLAGADSRLATLREQADSADRAVTVTGGGFYVDFAVPPGVDRLSRRDRFRLGGVDCEMDELDYGMGFLVLVEDGQLSQLEGYTYEEPIPESATNVEVYEREDDEFTS